MDTTILDIILKDYKKSGYGTSSLCYRKPDSIINKVNIRPVEDVSGKVVNTNLNITIKDPVLLQVHAYCMYNNYKPYVVPYNSCKVYYYTGTHIISMWKDDE